VSGKNVGDPAVHVAAPYDGKPAIEPVEPRPAGLAGRSVERPAVQSDVRTDGSELSDAQQDVRASGPGFPPASHARWREAGLAFNRAFERYLFLIVPATLVAGFFLSPWLKAATEAVPWMFAFLTFVMAMDCRLADIRRALAMPGTLAAVFAAVHVLVPAVAYAVGSAAFGSGSLLTVGLVLFAAIPVGVSSILWVGLSNGFVPFALAFVVLDSALSPIVVPWTIELLFGETVRFSFWGMALDLALMVVLPTALGVLACEWTKGKIKPATAPLALPLSKLAFAGVVAVNAAVIAPQVRELRPEAAAVVPMCVLIAAIGYAAGWLAGRLFRRELAASTLGYLSGMRNISLGIVLAAAHFEPLAAVPVVLAILIQQPLATLWHVLVRRRWQGRRLRGVG